MKTENRWLKTAELCAELRISRSTLARLVRKGMPGVKIGECWRFPLGDVLAWCDRQTFPAQDGER